MWFQNIIYPLVHVHKDQHVTFGADTAQPITFPPCSYAQYQAHSILMGKLP